MGKRLLSPAVGARKRAAIAAAQEAKLKGSPPKKRKKPLRSPFSKKLLGKLRSVEDEIIKKYKANVSFETMSRSILEEKEVKVSDQSIRLFVDLLVKEGKLKKRPRKRAGGIKKGFKEKTMEMLTPHNRFILEKAIAGKKPAEIHTILRGKMVVIGLETLTRYIEWLLERQKENPDLLRPAKKKKG